MKTIVCFGDSITDNTESESYVNKWQRLCDERYGKNAYLIRSAGISGETAWDGLQRLDRDVLRYKPDLVTICFGHNEVHLGVSVTDYQRSLEAIISRIQDIQSDIWLMTPTQIAVYELTDPDGRMPDRYVPYLDVLKEIAKKRGCPLLDLWQVFEGHSLDEIFTFIFDYDGLVGRDYLHPNQLGYEIIAKRLMTQL
jgi:acyl-CoA thioesterase I